MPLWSADRRYTAAWGGLPGQGFGVGALGGPRPKAMRLRERKNKQKRAEHPGAAPDDSPLGEGGVGVAAACLRRDLALFFRMKEVMEDNMEKLPSEFIEPISEPSLARTFVEMNPGNVDIDSARFSVGT